MPLGIFSGASNLPSWPAVTATWTSSWPGCGMGSVRVPSGQGPVVPLTATSRLGGVGLGVTLVICGSGLTSTVTVAGRQSWAALITLGPPQ